MSESTPVPPAEPVPPVTVEHGGADAEEASSGASTAETVQSSVTAAAETVQSSVSSASQSVQTSVTSATATVQSSVSSATTTVATTTDERPEILLGGAFAGGFVLAMILKRLGS